MEEKKSGFATASLVLGIIALCTSFIPFINNLSFGLAVIGIIFSLVSLIKKASIKKSIISIIICVIACVAVVNAQKSLGDSIDKAVNDFNGNNTEEILKNDIEVTIGTFEVVEGEYLTDTKLPVTITNKTGEKHSYSVTIEAVDVDGNRIDTDTAYANDLGAGQSQTFILFNFVTSDKIESLKSANFKVLEATR